MSDVLPEWEDARARTKFRQTGNHFDMNVLIADDDLMVLETLKQFVLHRRDTPLPARDGSEALTMLNAETIDLVITDVKMPGASGFDVLQAVKEKCPDVPVIIITGFADMDMAMQAVNGGAFAFLPKPVVFPDLDAKMSEASQVLAERREEQRRLAALQQTAMAQQVRLERARSLSASILHAIPFPVCAIDAARRIHLVNPAFCDMFTEAAAEGRLLEEVVPALNFQSVAPDQLFDMFQDPAQASGRTLTFPDSGEKEDARYFDVTGFGIDPMDFPDVGQSLICLFIQDITLRVKHREAALERQVVLKAVSDFRELVHARVATSDFQEHMVRHLYDVIGQFNDVCIELRYKNRVYAKGRAIPGAAPYWNRTLRIENREVGALSLFSDAPRRVHVQRVLMDDLIDIALRQIEAHEFQLGIVQSERLCALGEMAAGVAHELNQPLTGIRTFAEGLLYGMKYGWDLSEAQLRETLLEIVGQVDRATGIITYMRDFSRQRDDDTFAPFAIADAIENVRKLINAQMRVHGIEFNSHLPADLPLCRGSQHQIEQVLLNVLTNARHALDDYQQVPHGEGWRARIAIGAEERDSFVRLSITDTGGGVPEEIENRIFEPFFTTKGAGKGTGLGLSISRNIAQAHGGNVWLENRPGLGATFYLEIPCEQKERDLGISEREPHTQPVAHR